MRFQLDKFYRKAFDVEIHEFYTYPFVETCENDDDVREDILQCAI